MKANVHPVKLVLGKTYEVGYNFGNKSIFKLIKTTPKGYKFFNEKTSQCWRQPVMYASKEPNHIDKGETWFFVQDSLEIRELPKLDNDYTNTHTVTSEAIIGYLVGAGYALDAVDKSYLRKTIGDSLQSAAEWQSNGCDCGQVACPICGG